MQEVKRNGFSSIAVVIVSGLVAYYLGTFVMDVIIIGTTTTDMLVKTVVPLAVGGSVLLGVLKVTL